MPHNHPTSPSLIIETTIEFYGRTLPAAEENHQVYISLPTLCQALNLSPAAEMRRVKSTVALAEGLRPFALRGPGKQTHLRACLRTDLVPGWLIGIQSGRIQDPALREKLVIYQREACQVAGQVFGPDAEDNSLIFDLASIKQRLDHIAQRVEAIQQLLATAGQSA